MPRVIELFVDQFLAISQNEPVTNPRGESVTQVIAFTDHAKNYRTVAEVSQTLHLGETVTVRRSVYHVAVRDHLSFYQSGARAVGPQSLTQFFWIGQRARLVEFEQLVQSISFSQVASCNLAKAAVDTLVMTDSATCVAVRSVTVAHTLFIGSSGTAYVLNEESYSIELPELSGPNAPQC